MALGYDRTVLFAFLADAGELDPETGDLLTLNEIPVDNEDRAMLRRWRTTDRTVAKLDSVDRLLMRHKLMTWELEHWGETHMGDDGFRSSSQVLAKPAKLC